MKEKHILLSISVLASRKKELVRRCLDSLRPILERLPSELILVDTSEDKEVHEMLLTYSDHVVDFHWCNDFAKARNVGLERAKGEWFLYIDDDEWFENAEVLIAFFESGDYRKFDYANYIQRNYYDEKLINYSDVWASRMIRRREETRFRSKIHEYLYPQGGRCINLHLIAGHTGYIFQTQEDRLKHFERNHSLLLDMIREEPGRLRWRMQLAQEFQAIQRWEELLEFSEESLEFCKDCDDEDDNRNLGTFYAGAAESALSLENYGEVEAIVRRMRGDRRCSELCHAYLELLLAQAYFRQRKWKEAQESVAEFYRKKDFLDANPRKLEEQEGALIVESAFDSIQMRRALSLAMGCALMQGNVSILRDKLEELEWDQDIIYVSDEFFPILIEGIAKLPQEPVFVRAMQLLWNNQAMQPKLQAEIQGWAKKDAGAFQQLLRITAQVEGKHWYLWYARFIAADTDADTAGLAESFRGFCQNVPGAVSETADMIEILYKHHLSIEEGYLSYALMRIAEGKVLHSDEADIEERRGFLTEFAERAISYCSDYYKDDIIQNMPELLPEYAQAAFYISRALAMEDTDHEGALDAFKLAADVYPSLANAIKAYMRVLEAG